MTPTTDQLAALRAAAEAAHQPGVFWYQQDMLERFTKQFTGADADATYITAANPSAVLALLDRIDAQAARIAELERDAARYRWLTQDAYVGECFTERGGVLEICGTDREVPVLHERSTDRDEVDAAIDAALTESNALSQDIVIGA
ncbi:ead/Ea22-like family protein [Chromobacterium violaceum]|uniref:ead/Ea22-like family protein n=1 Tax=Chromobacterium violaceum TaxID=536 RepID=UPI001E58BBD9|nr:ead/Ea22-like family protein [Chromobacterium violaceum]MCD0492289.1 ead/Ea22-like family protein [Chromobacterium violaceum]